MKDKVVWYGGGFIVPQGAETWVAEFGEKADRLKADGLVGEPTVSDCYDVQVITNDDPWKHWKNKD